MKISYLLINKICEINSCKELMENNTVKGVFKHNHKYYVCTGTCSSFEKGWISATIYEAVPLKFKSSHNSIRYTKIERGYVGREFSYMKENMILLGPPIDVYPRIQSEEQLQLF